MKAVQSAGHAVHEVEIRLDGTILIRTAPEKPVEETTGDDIVRMFEQALKTEDDRKARAKQRLRERYPPRL
jgi:hypothetical protein